jgi:hypothetical protein
VAATRFKRSGIQVNVLSVLSTLNMPALAVETADIATSAVTEAKIADATIGLGGATHGVAAGKLDAIYASKATATVDVAVNITHGLGRTPVGYALVSSDKAANAYDGGTHTATHLKVKCDVTTVVGKYLIW